MGAAELNAGEASAKKSRNLEILGISVWHILASVIPKGLRLTASRIQLTNSESWTQSNSGLKRSMTDRSKEVSNLKSKLSNDVVCLRYWLNWLHNVAQNEPGCQVAEVTFLTSQKKHFEEGMLQSILLPPTKATATAMYCQYWMNEWIDWLIDGWMDGWIVGLNWLLAPSNCTAGWISAEPWYRCAPTTGFQRCQVPHRIHGTGIPTCTIKINQMQVRIPYTDPTVWVTVYYIFMRESLIRIFLNIFFVGSQDFPGCSCPIQAQKASSFLSW